MQYIKKIKLDFNASDKPQTFSAKQFDTESRYLLIEPTMDNEKFDVRDCKVSLYAELPNRSFVVNDCTVNDEGNISVELTEQTLFVTGIIRCELKLFQETTVLSSCPFYIKIIKSANKDVYSDIELSVQRGTSKIFLLTIYDENGKSYKINEDDKLIFGVKKLITDDEYIIKKIISSDNSNGNGYNIALLPEDTENLEVGEYLYEVGLQTSDGSYYIVVKFNKFIIEPTVTARE